MKAKEFLKKYGVYIIGGIVVLYLLIKNIGGSRQQAISAANPNALELARLQASSQQSADQLQFQRDKLAQDLEIARLNQQTELAKIQAALGIANRQADIYGSAASQGALAQLLNSIAGLAGAIGKTARGGSSGGSGGGGTTATGQPGVRPRPLAIPEPNLGASAFNPPNFVPGWPEPFIPGTFNDPLTRIDTGFTFTDQIPEPNLGASAFNPPNYTPDWPTPNLPGFDLPTKTESELPVAVPEVPDSIYTDVPAGGGGSYMPPDYVDFGGDYA